MIMPTYECTTCNKKYVSPYYCYAKDLEANISLDKEEKVKCPECGCVCKLFSERAFCKHNIYK